MKKIYALILMALAALTASAYDQATEGTKYYGSQCEAYGLADGTVAISAYYLADEQTEVEFPATIQIWTTVEPYEMTAEYEVSSVGYQGWEMWFGSAGMGGITSMTIPEGVKSINANFWNASALETLNFPSTLVSIDRGWCFGGSKGLKNVIFNGIPATIAESVFAWTDDQMEVAVSYWNAKGLKALLGDGINAYYKVWSTQFDEEWNNGSNLLTAYTDEAECKRNLVGGEWETVCLPFWMTREQVEEVFGDDAQLATFNSVSGTEMQFTTVPVDGETYLEANKPFLIKAGQSIVGFSMQYVWLNDNFDNMELVRGDYTFVGSQDGAREELPTGNIFVYNAGTAAKAAAASDVKGLSAFFIAPDAVNAITVTVDGTPTGITFEKAESAQAPADGVKYNVAGQRVSAAKGFYIQDGKKYVK